MRYIIGLALLLMVSCSDRPTSEYTIQITYMGYNVDTITVKSFRYPEIEEWYQNSNITHHTLYINERQSIAFDVRRFKVLNIK